MSEQAAARRRQWDGSDLFRFDPDARYSWRLFDRIFLATVTFNRVDLTRRLIESCLRHIHLPFELIVVDNASEDGTGDYLTELERRLPAVRVIRNRRNLGLARAQLQIRDAVDDGLLLLFDNDIEILSNYAAVHVLKAFLALKLETGSLDHALGFRLINAEEYGFRHAHERRSYRIPHADNAPPRTAYAAVEHSDQGGRELDEEVVIGWTRHLMGGTLACPASLFRQVRLEDCYPKYIGGTDSFKSAEFRRLGVSMGYIENGPITRHNDWPYSEEKIELYRRYTTERATADLPFLRWKLRRMFGRQRRRDGG